MANLEEQVDRILKIVIEVQEDIKNLTDRVGRLEEAHEKVFNKLDGFLVLIQRHEAEIAALRASYDRLADRIERLEKQRV